MTISATRYERLNTVDYLLRLTDLFECMGVVLCLTHPNSHLEVLADQFEIARNAKEFIKREDADLKNTSFESSTYQESPIMRRQTKRPKVNLLDLQSLTPLVSSKTERGWFDFTRNQVLCLEDIVRSCYCNPQRQKYPNIRQYASLYTEHDYPEYFLKRLFCELPYALKKFNDAQIHLHDVSTFYKNGTVKFKYLEQIKTCRWYGPY